MRTNFSIIDKLYHSQIYVWVKESQVRTLSFGNLESQLNSSDQSDAYCKCGNLNTQVKVSLAEIATTVPEVSGVGTELCICTCLFSGPFSPYPLQRSSLRVFFPKKTIWNSNFTFSHSHFPVEKSQRKDVLHLVSFLSFLPLSLFLLLWWNTLTKLWRPKTVSLFPPSDG